MPTTLRERTTTATTTNRQAKRKQAASMTVFPFVPFSIAACLHLAKRQTKAKVQFSLCVEDLEIFMDKNLPLSLRKTGF